MPRPITLERAAAAGALALLRCFIPTPASAACPAPASAALAETPPPPLVSVRIVSPAAAEVVYGPLVLRARVIPPTGARVLKVDFFADGVHIASDPITPYEAPWDAGKDLSSHFFRVVARFADGTTAEDLITTRGLTLQHREVVLGSAIERVQILVSVTDLTGRPVAGLSAADIEVREAGVTVPIKTFKVVSDSGGIPLSIAVLIDRSGSMQFQMKKWAAACVALLSTVRPIDQVRVSAFSDETVILQDFTHDAASLAASVAGVVPAGGSTSLFRAVFETVRDLRDLPGRKALILMTDGLDTEFGSPSQPITAAMYPILIEAGRMAIRSGVTVILILPGPSGRGYLAVQDLALQTGGWYMYPSDDLRELMRKLGQRLLSSYVIEYDVDRPRDADRKRPVKVALRGEKAAGLEVHTSLGTYARLDTMEELKKDLSQGNGRQRARAARELGRSGGPEIVPELMKALKAEVPEVRAAAAAALAERREPEAMDKVLKLIHDADLGVREAAFEAAVRYGAAALPALVDLSRRGGPERAPALRALGDIGDPNAIPVLTAGLAERDCPLRAAAADGLGWLAAINGEGIFSRGLGGRAQEGKVADLLRKAIDDPCPAAAEAAALSLARFADRLALRKLLDISSELPGSPRLVEVLTALAFYPTPESVAAVERHLASPEPIHSAARRAAAALYTASAGTDAFLRRDEALRRLVLLGGEEAMSSIRLLIGQSAAGYGDPEWRAQLEAALRRITGE